MDKDEIFYPTRGEPHEPSLSDDLLLWFPGIGWFYYLWFGYSPRTVNHYNPVGTESDPDAEFLLARNEHSSSFSFVFQLEPVFYNKHLLGVSLSLGTYLGMVSTRCPQKPIPSPSSIRSAT